MEQIKESEKKLIGKSFLSEQFASFLLNKSLKESRLLHLSRAGSDMGKLIKAYNKQQELISKYLPSFIAERQPEKEEDLPPMIIRWVNPLLHEYYLYEEEMAAFIIEKEL